MCWQCWPVCTSTICIFLPALVYLSISEQKTRRITICIASPRRLCFHSTSRLQNVFPTRPHSPISTPHHNRGRDVSFFLFFFSKLRHVHFDNTLRGYRTSKNPKRHHTEHNTNTLSRQKQRGSLSTRTTYKTLDIACHCDCHHDNIPIRH